PLAYVEGLPVVTRAGNAQGQQGTGRLSLSVDRVGLACSGLSRLTENCVNSLVGCVCRLVRGARLWAVLRPWCQRRARPPFGRVQSLADREEPSPAPNPQWPRPHTPGLRAPGRPAKSRCQHSCLSSPHRANAPPVIARGCGRPCELRRCPW